MPSTNLELTIQKIISDAAAQIAHAVRRSIADDIAGAAGSVAAPAPKRGPGRPKKVLAEAMPVAAALAPKRGPGRPKKTAGAPAPKKGGKRARRSAAELAADDSKILEFVKANGGLRSEQIGKKLKLSKIAVSSGLLRLREAKKVKTKGQRRGTTYLAA